MSAPPSSGSGLGGFPHVIADSADGAQQQQQYCDPQSGMTGPPGYPQVFPGGGQPAGLRSPPASTSSGFGSAGAGAVQTSSTGTNSSSQAPAQLASSGQFSSQPSPVAGAPYSGYSGGGGGGAPGSGWGSSGVLPAGSVGSARGSTYGQAPASGGSGGAFGYSSTTGSIPLPQPGSGGASPYPYSGGGSAGTYAPGGVSSGGALPLPPPHGQQVLSGAPPGAYQLNGGAPPASYPGYAPHHHAAAPMYSGGGPAMMPASSPGILGVLPPPAGSGPYGGAARPGDAVAGPKAASLAAAALASVQPGAAGGGAQHPQGLAVPAVVRPQLGEDLYCSCPMVCVVGTNHGAPHAVPLNVMSLQFTVHCHISMAFVQLQLVCHYPMSWNDAPLVFFLPKSTDTTITDLSVENMVRPSVLATAVVPLEDMKRFGGGPGGKAAAAAMRGAAGDADGEDGVTDPEMFMLALPPGVPGDQYRVKLSYFHPMVFDFAEGRYVLRLPATVPQVCLAQGSSINSVLDVNVTINTGGVEEVDLLVPSHPITVTESQRGSISFELDTKAAWDNGDFLAGYRVWRDQLTASVHVEAPQPELPDQRGTFALSITPPGPEHTVSFPRSVVFMFDRSGSMTGDPIRYAKAALLTGLHMLGPQDSFTVVAFDHEQLWWTDRLIEATPENILGCMHWVNDDLSARGTTDINAPLQRALRLLAGAPGLPLVFLLTDGCVDDERDICKMAEAQIAAASQPRGAATTDVVVTTDAATGGVVTAVHAAPPPPPRPPALAPRLYTFGIGPYCNHYFLKRLAAIGRGMNDVAFRPHAIQSVMERMLAAAALPMLSDVQISVQGLTQVELYPFPIPDVFVGSPLLVCGKFEGDWPETVDICGALPDGTSWCQTVPSLPAGDLPLHKVFVKSQLDLMTADAWMADNPPNLVQQIVELSMASGVTSAHTVMVGFETTPARYEAMQATPPNERRKKIVRWAIGGAAGIGVVAGVAAALTFGDLASTLSNVPVGDAMSALGGDLSGFFDSLAPGMDCCGGGCDCCGDCGEVCGACLTC